MVLNICIQNLGKYNEGELWFEWLTLPATEEEINVALDKIKVCHTDEDGVEYKYYDECGNPYEELHMPDWECDIPGLEYNEWWSIHELNRIAKLLDDLNEYEYKHVCAYMEAVGCDVDRALEEYEDRSRFWCGMSTSDVAEELADEWIACLCHNNKAAEELARYFDYEQYERELDLTTTEEGVIEIW